MSHVLVLVAVIIGSWAMAQFVTRPQKMVVATRLFRIVAIAGLALLGSHLIEAGLQAVRVL